jgi:hypothetical protein
MDIHTVHQIFVIVVMKWFRNKHSCSHSGEVDVFLMSLSLLIFLLAIHCSHLGPGCHRFTDGRPMDQILHKTTHHTQGQSATDSTVCPTITHSYYFQTQQNSYFQVTDSEMLGFLPKDKAYRIHQVALTGSIGPDDGREPFERTYHLKPFVRLEILQLQTLEETHF